MSEMRITEVWFWPLPAEGEAIADRPPVDLMPFLRRDTRVSYPDTTKVTYELVRDGDADTPTSAS